MFRCTRMPLGFYIAALKFAFSRGLDQAVAIGNSFLEQGTQSDAETVESDNDEDSSAGKPQTQAVFGWSSSGMGMVLGNPKPRH